MIGGAEAPTPSGESLYLPDEHRDTLKVDWGLNPKACSRYLGFFQDLSRASRLLASARVSKFSQWTRRQGLKFLVDLVIPKLCCWRRWATSLVQPI